MSQAGTASRQGSVEVGSEGRQQGAKQGHPLQGQLGLAALNSAPLL